MVKEKDNCFKCGILTVGLIPFYMIDDWCQFEIKLCQDCLLKANQKIFEAAEEWLCPVCKKVYCCVICGSKDHHTKLCSYYIPDIDDYPTILKLLHLSYRKAQFFSSFRKRTLHWFTHTPYGVYHLGEVGEMEMFQRKLERERSEMQTLLMNIRKKVRKKMPEISDMIKYYFNSKYGEMAEGITTSATFSKKVLENAIYKYAIYQDTDSFILNSLPTKEIIERIKHYPNYKNIIVVTGDRGSGKSSAVLELLDQWVKLETILYDLTYIMSSEVWRVYTENKMYKFHVIPSITYIKDDITKKICLHLHIEQTIRYERRKRAIGYWYSLKCLNEDIIAVNQIDIPFCCKERYEEYVNIRLRIMQYEFPIKDNAILSKKIKEIKEFISRSTVDNDFDWDIDNSPFQSIFNKSESMFSKNVIGHHAIYKHAIYQDTDSLMFNSIELDGILDKITRYTVWKHIILVTGGAVVGKTSSIITLIEEWKKRDKIYSDMFFSFNSETWRVYHKQREYNFHIIPSLDFNNDDIFKQTCLIINVVSIDLETKEMKVILSWLSKKANNTDIIMVHQAIIPFCSIKGYEDYKQKKLTYFKELGVI